MFEFETFEVLKTKEFTKVIDCFQNKSNDEIGHYGQALNNYLSIKKTCLKNLLYSFAFKNYKRFGKYFLKFLPPVL